MSSETAADVSGDQTNVELPNAQEKIAEIIFEMWLNTLKDRQNVSINE